ncbi:MAG: bacillithiol biosynthesis deacetylase BshB1 [Deinococcales bacterium]
MKLEILAIAPHPDDAEIGCGGSLIRAAQQGRAVGILELTRGEMGTLGTPEIRDSEAQAAARVMGLAYRGNVALPDGTVQDTLEQRLRVAQAIRHLRPHTLLLPHESDRHPDHVGAAQLCTSAVHLAGLQKAALEGQAHKVQRVLYYQGNAPIQANVLVDVSSVLDLWEQAVMAHRSQFTGQAVSETVTPEILERRKARMMYWGTFVGVRYAEAFATRVPVLLEI